jgi:DNA-nicking Smr family endonuclease
VGKSRPKSLPKPKEFHPIPFRALKGIVLPNILTITQEPLVVQKPLETSEDSLDLFMQAVGGVKPIHGQNTKPAKNNSASPGKKTDTTEGISPLDETASTIFIQEINRLKLDTTFIDSVPDDEEIKPLSGNRLRQVKRGIVSVEYQLDLHGLRRDEALAALPHFFSSAIHKKQKAVLVITGKGNHSREEPVLQQAVASWLRDAGRKLVVEFAPAPREMGGNGAFVVFLRSSPASIT